MLLSVFENSLFLRSLGWGIANSFWQAALLWMLYVLLATSYRNASALLKHNLSLLLLFVSFAWFTITVTENYLTGGQSSRTLLTAGLVYISSAMHVWLQWLSVLYIVLLLGHVVRFIQKLNGLHIMRTGELKKAPADTRLFTTQTAFHIGIKRKVGIWLSENVDVPSVIGIFKPIILLPVTALNQLTTAQAESVILHELAHIKRNDYLVNLLQTTAELMLFFNPFAKLLGNAARKERENCCDDWVLNYRYNKSDYAAALFMLEQQRLQPVVLKIAATNGTKDLLRRIQRLFIAIPQTNFGLGQQLKLISLCTLLLATGFFFSPVYQEKTETTINDETKAVALFATTKEESNHANDPKERMTRNVMPGQVTPDPKSKPGEKQATAAKQEWVTSSTTLVNEELLKGRSYQNKPVLAANQPPTKYPRLFVEVEEEKSGVKGKNKYLLEVQNKNGNPEIKPLVIMNKKMKLKPANKADGHLKKLSKKKRVTA